MLVKYSKSIPDKVVRDRSKIVLSYNVRETTDEEIIEMWKSLRGGVESEPDAWFKSEHKYMYNVVSVPMGQWNYGGIVNAIIRDKYNTDEMESITNNVTAVVSEFFEELVVDGLISATKFLSESFKGGLNMEAFKEMQEWRVMAKREAKGVLKL